MLRFIYVLIRNLHRAWMIPQAGYYAVRERKYSEEFRYQYDLKMISDDENRTDLHLRLWQR